ncbi:MAG TPA: hypothetical protein VFM84_07250 [Holophagaceae bacterium]|nr:hypothetical protein [Holophagaceae bacterium]
MLSLLTLLLAPSPALLPPEPPALIRLGDQDDDDQGHGHGHGHGRGHKDRDDKAWKGDERRDRKAEDDYWKHERKWHKHDYREGDRRPAPPWMNTWWQPGESRYCAVVPGDPSQVYVLVGGRWVLRHVYDPRFRADVSGAFQLPVGPPPPVPLPHVGLDLHVVLFN